MQDIKFIIIFYISCDYFFNLSQRKSLKMTKIY